MTANADLTSKLILVDLDDTLVDTSPVYTTALNELVACLQAVLPGPPTREVILEAQEHIDADAARDHDFDATRFPRSFVDAYRQLAADQNTPIDTAIEARCYAIGATVMTARPALLPHAREMLAALEDKAELWLYTLGVEETQLPKMNEHALAPHFDAVHVVSRKNTPTLEKLVNGRARADVAILGDSLRFEINPALELGIFAVHFKRPHLWKFAQPPAIATHYREVTDLRDAARVLQRDFLGES